MKGKNRMTDKIGTREFEETPEFREKVEKALAKNPEAVKLMADIDDAQDRYIEAQNQAEEFEANMDMAEYDEDEAENEADREEAQNRYIEARNQKEEAEANMDMAEYDEDKAKEKLSEIKKQIRLDFLKSRAMAKLVQFND